MDTDSRLYPDEQYIKRLRELGVRGDINLAMLGELLPVGTKTMRVDSFWFCFLGQGFQQDAQEANARARLLIALLENEIVKV